MYRELCVIEKGPVFEKATAIQTKTIPTKVQSNEVLLRHVYAGVNATDINAIQNTYGDLLTPPYPIGLEGLGQVTLVGSDVKHLHVGDYVVSYSRGGYSEYQIVSANVCFPVPTPDPHYLALCVSGLTAAAAIGELGRPRTGEVALVTAAAGGTGTIAVQLLKHKYGCHVVGTCSSAEKEAYLKSIGCDAVINYKVGEAELTEALRRAAPRGYDIVYECVGGALREAALQQLAVGGRVIFIGAISGYKSGATWRITEDEDLLRKSALLIKSASLNGFLLTHFAETLPGYFADLRQRYDAEELKIHCDQNIFEGLEQAANAVAYLHSGKSFGKVVLKL
ncbi:oxidoreductase [Strigomonas culicis]|uniref:Oxidoreductase n=1 Tax=Strigomonas culicis TaxID=28005 RepID=S9V8D8_9TRYP|nr:oxidoreductase [Strigomonas culicis]|eukprot:EPY23236.1 oxidoreductase [Strigomonas culicis]